MNIDNLKKENPFQVPEGYFDTLPKVVTNRIKVIHKRKRYTFIFSSIAAIIITLLVINLWIFIPKSSLNSGDSPSLASQNNTLNEENILLANNQAAPTSEQIEQLESTIEMNFEVEEVVLNNLDYQIIDYYEDDDIEDIYLY